MSVHHILTILDVEEGDSCEWNVSCPHGTCGFEECMEEHPGCEECASLDEHCPNACGEEMREFHGVVHSYQSGYGWTVEYKGCVVKAEVHNLGVWELFDGLPLRAGSWQIKSTWFGDECELSLGEEVTA